MAEPIAREAVQERTAIVAAPNKPATVLPASEAVVTGKGAQPVKDERCPPSSALFDIGKTMVGAFFGAGFAFGLTIYRDRRLRIREQRAAGNMAMTILIPRRCSSAKASGVDVLIGSAIPRVAISDAS